MPIRCSHGAVRRSIPKAHRYDAPQGRGYNLIRRLVNKGVSHASRNQSSSFLRSERAATFFLLINWLGGTYIFAVSLMGRGFMRFAKKRYRSGSKGRSFFHMMYQLGFDFHAVPSL